MAREHERVEQRVLVRGQRLAEAVEIRPRQSRTQITTRGRTTGWPVRRQEERPGAVSI